MPVCPVIDSHLHLWDPNLIRYPWLDNIEKLNRPYLPTDFDTDTKSLSIDGMVFVQCDAEPAACETEVQWVQLIARQDPRICGLIAWAPVENGAAVAKDLAALQTYSLLRGIRRIIQSECDLEFCLRPDFVTGVRTLADFDLSFDICIDHRHLANLLRFVEKVPDVVLILDHIAKPPIRNRKMSQWTAQLRALASFENVVCKISGLATEADHQNWTREQLRPYVDEAIESFGFDRILFGGDWPVSTLAIQYTEWVEFLDSVFVGVSVSEQRKFWRGNAVRTYRLGFPGP